MKERDEGSVEELVTVILLPALSVTVESIQLVVVCLANCLTVLLSSVMVIAVFDEVGGVIKSCSPSSSRYKLELVADL